MKKISKLFFAMILVLSVCLITGCGKQEKITEENVSTIEEEKPVTVASSLVEQFKTEIKDNKNLEEVANKLAENEKLSIMTMVEVLDKKSDIFGFNTTIKNFKTGVAIKASISTIPFVAYIFEVENPEEFQTTLKENANLRWNICTEADDMESAIYENYVFFVMSRSSFE